MMRCIVKMIRKQVYIKPAHERTLKRRARELGVTEAELIRQGIEQLARSASAPDVAPDPSAWIKARRWIERRRRMKVPQTGRTWTRDELYEERLARYSR